MYQKCVLSVILVLALGTVAVHAELVGHWRLDEGAGTVASDSSGYGNDGTLEGDAHWAAGYLDGAVEGDGDGDYVRIPHAEVFSLSDAATVAVWVYGGLPPDQIICKGTTTGSAWTDSYSFRIDNDTAYFRKVNFRGRVGTDSLNGNTAIPTDEWTHIAITFDVAAAGDNQKLYINGQLDAQNRSETPLGTNTGDLLLGADAYGTTRWHWEGKLDDVRIYDYALAQEELELVMVGAVGDYPLALSPAPKDGEMIEATSQVLAWRAGSFAASHQVYFGESFDDVNQATPESDAFQGNQTATEFAVQGLTPGATYYWRVDEVNDLDPNSPWKGTVWSFVVKPLTAWNPTPADEMKYVLLDQELGWSAGMGALFHYVLLGEDFDEVNDAPSSDGEATATNTCAPTLEPGKTYYWRVDEFAGATTHKGEVWSFTTLPEVAVADPDLVGWWTLDEGTGMTAVDWSGYGHHGALAGDPEWTDGYHGGALKFAAGKHVDCGYDAADEVTDDFTLATWVKMDPGTAGYYHGIAGKLTNSTTYMGFALVRHTSNVFRLWVGDATDDLAKSAAGSDVQYTDTEWHHVAGVREGQVNALYVDGVRQAETSSTDFTPSPEWFHIGRQYSHLSDRYFRGVVDDVRVYNRVLTDAELAEVMRGNPLLAASPSPSSGAIVDIRNATMLSWTAGDTAVSHDVYFGADRDALELQGNQPGTSFSLAGLVEFGGDDYYWRVDEVAADGTVETGYVWRFTVPAYLIVDDFESYDNNVGSRVFEKWIDGFGYTQPEPGHPGNGTGSAAGHDIWSGDTTYTYLMETANAYSGQALPMYYDNSLSPFYSEVERTFTPARNWTAEGVATLVFYFRGPAENTGQLYLKINGVKLPYNGDPADIAGQRWVEWPVDLASVGTNLTSVSTLTIGVEGGEAGVLYIDEIRLIRP